jgi:glycosyltransferase involved in cell wall biosynthesis
MFNQKKLLEAFYPSQTEGIQAAIKALDPCITKHWVEPIPYEKFRFHKLLLITKSFFSKTPYTVNWLKSRSANKLLGEIISNNNYDLIHFDTISLDVYRKLAHKNTKVIMNHHNIESHMMGRRAMKEKNYFKKFYFQMEYKKLYKYERDHLPNYDGHIVCSKDDAHRLRELSQANNIEVIPNGIDISCAEPAKFIDKGSLLFIGGLSWYPNKDAVFHFFDKIYPILRKRNINVTVDIIGRNAPKELIELASSDDSINIHGFVDDVSKYYERSNIYICPIRDGGGTKLKILDAFAKKMAVVAYSIACEGIEVNHEENVMVAENVEQFAQYIIELINDIDKCMRLGNNAFKLVERKYNYNSIGQKLSSFYLILSSIRSQH